MKASIDHKLVGSVRRSHLYELNAWFFGCRQFALHWCVTVLGIWVFGLSLPAAGQGSPMVRLDAARGTTVFLRCLTFELSRHQRCDARARVAKMYRVPPAGPAWHAVGARLERGVRHQFGR